MFALKILIVIFCFAVKQPKMADSNEYLESEATPKEVLEAAWSDARDVAMKLALVKDDKEKASMALEIGRAHV